MTAAEWFWIASSIAPAPIWWLWRRAQIRRQQIRDAALREKMMRRERFAGVVRVPGTTETVQIGTDD